MLGGTYLQRPRHQSVRSPTLTLTIDGGNDAIAVQDEHDKRRNRRHSIMSITSNMSNLSGSVYGDEEEGTGPVRLRRMRPTPFKNKLYEGSKYNFDDLKEQLFNLTPGSPKADASSPRSLSPPSTLGNLHEPSTAQSAAADLLSLGMPSPRQEYDDRYDDDDDSEEGYAAEGGRSNRSFRIDPHEIDDESDVSSDTEDEIEYPLEDTFHLLKVVEKEREFKAQWGRAVDGESSDFLSAIFDIVGEANRQQDVRKQHLLMEVEKERRKEDEAHNQHMQRLLHLKQTVEEKQMSEIAQAERAVAQSLEERKKQQDEERALTLQQENEEKAVRAKEAAATKQAKAAADAKQQTINHAKKNLEDEAKMAKAELAQIQSGEAVVKQRTQQDEERRKQVMVDVVPRIQALTNARNLFKDKIEGYQQRKRTRVEIKKRVNQISGTQEQITARTNDLKKIIQDSDRVNDPIWSAFVLVQVAENIVDKGDTRVHLKQSAAFPIAYAAYHLVLFKPPLLDLILGLMFTKCRYTMPDYANEGDPNWKQDAGYKEEGDEKKLELEEKYLERMGGHVALFAAFLQIPEQNHPYGLKQAWKWLTRLLNQPPCHATSVVLEAFLKVAGYEMGRAFGQQFKKVLHFIETDFWNRLPQAPGPQNSSRIRIRQFLTKYKQDGRLEAPEGKDPSNQKQQ